MESREEYRGPSGVRVGGIVLAIIVGALAPLMSVLQISLLVPVLMLPGVLAAYLKVRDGWVPVAVLAAAMAISSAFLLGGTLAVILLVASLMPSVIVVRGAAQKEPFFEQIKRGITAYVAALLAAMLIAYGSFGGNMVARFVDLLREEYARVPDAALQPLVTWANANSTLPTSMAQSGEVITVEYLRSQLSGMLDLIQQTYAQLLPGTLLSGAALSGVLAVLWANWTMARRGMATNDSFVGMSGWFLPAGVSLGAVGLWLVGLILMYASGVRGMTVYMTIAQVAGAAFAIQALSALDRRMLRAGRELGHRRVLIALFAVLALLMRGFAAMLSYVGVASALFGSHGAIKLWMQRRQDDHHSDNDD